MALTVLVVKLAAIGDVAMALPMVTALRAQHPGCAGNQLNRYYSVLKE